MIAILLQSQWKNYFTIFSYLALLHGINCLGHLRMLRVDRTKPDRARSLSGKTGEYM